MPLTKTMNERSSKENSRHATVCPNNGGKNIPQEKLIGLELDPDTMRQPRHGPK